MNYFQDNFGNCFLEKDLWKAAKGLKSKSVYVLDFGDPQEFMVELLSEPCLDEITTGKVIKKELERFLSVDLSFPIILTPDNIIADGYHRWCKAWMNGRKTIKAIKLEQMPKPFKSVITNE